MWGKVSRKKVARLLDFVQIKCVLSIKESHFNAKSGPTFSHLLTVRAEGLYQTNAADPSDNLHRQFPIWKTLPTVRCWAMDFLDGSFLARWLNAGLIERNECTNINLQTVQVFYEVRIPSMSTQHRYKARTIHWIDVGDDRMVRSKKSQNLSCLFLFSWLLFLIKIRICVPVPGEWSGEGQQARIFFSSSVHLYWKIIKRKGAYRTAEKDALLIQGSEWSFRR